MFEQKNIMMKIEEALTVLGTAEIADIKMVQNNLIYDLKKLSNTDAQWEQKAIHSKSSALTISEFLLHKIDME